MTNIKDDAPDKQMVEVERWNAITAKAIADDYDHLTDPAPELAAWLVAQLASYPKRLHGERTTNDRFTRISVAAHVLSLTRERDEALMEVAKLHEAVGRSAPM